MPPKAEKKPAEKAPAGKAPAKATKSKGDHKKRKTRKETYSSYIYKVLKQVHPDTGISNKGTTFLFLFLKKVIAFCFSILCSNF